VAGAHLKLVNSAGALVRETSSDTQGNFSVDGIDAGKYRLRSESDSFVPANSDISLAEGQQKELNVQFLQLASVLEAFTVVASELSSLAPDPSETLVIHDLVLDANPGRPGAPISIAGLPIETASGGIKAPQYFAPGVAGDHAEPIAQFFQVGNFLFPNHLPANAHGNGMRIRIS
jgi:Carboxypeptidase regulatory-like domain